MKVYRARSISRFLMVFGGGCQFTALEKDSRHTESVFGDKISRKMCRMLRSCQSEF